MNNVQNANILLPKAKYTSMIENGAANIIAIPFIPEVLNVYRLSKNRRKSSNTLPPFSWAYSDILLE